ARIVLFLRRAGTAYGPNDVVADLNRYAAAKSENIGDVALWGIFRIHGSLLKFQCGRPEHPRGVSLAPRHFHLLRAPVFVTHHDQYLSGTIDDGDRRVV